jgi:hypothetical protein
MDLKDFIKDLLLLTTESLLSMEVTLLPMSSLRVSMKTLRNCN